MSITSNVHSPASVDRCLDLPPELWLMIMTEIKAKDILSLCSVSTSNLSFYATESRSKLYLQTCRSLHIMLSARTIWILILRCVSHEDGVYFLSYDIDNMDIEDLQRAAMGRYRWGQLLEQNWLQTTSEELSNPPVVIPASEPITLPSAMTMGQFDSGEKDSTFYLIPGGRYLVLVAFPSLKLLDLGIPGRRPLSTPLELAKVELVVVAESAHEVRLLAWEHDSGSIKVLVGVEHGFS